MFNVVLMTHLSSVRLLFYLPNSLSSIDIKYQIWKLGVVFTDNVSISHIWLYNVVFFYYLNTTTKFFPFCFTKKQF